MLLLSYIPIRMNSHKYIRLPIFAVLLLIASPSLSANKLATEKNEHTFLEERLMAKKVPIVKVKKPKQLQWNCTIVRGGSWTGTNETISVGRKAFTSLYKLNFNSSSLSYLQTCKFVVNPGSTRAVYALPDNSSMINAKITAYLDGEPVSSIFILRGEADTLIVNTSDSKSMAIEITVSFENEFAYSFNNYIYIVNE
jgi:hypothetical protein